MTEKELMRIANGSDVRGVAIEGVPNEPVTLTPEAANIIAASFVTFLAKKTGKAVSNLKIAIGHDSRLSADSLKTAALKGLLSTGVKAYDCGLASTPSMFMSTVFESTDMDGSIMITASCMRSARALRRCCANYRQPPPCRPQRLEILYQRGRCGA